MVDAYACIEQERLHWIRNNQAQLRDELYSGLRDAINQGDVMADNVGKMTILPLSYKGGLRYRVQNYQDAMAICRYVGYPDLFLTFTCNPKWSENDYMLEDIDGQKSDDRLDIVSRVFSIKLMELINDNKCRHIFGRVTDVVYTIEFQKRGLPHAHILVFLHSDDKIQLASQVDVIISAKIPDKENDPVAYSAVDRFMVHGPCGILNHNSPCMINGKCSKHYSKRFHDSTLFDDDGFPMYIRRDNDRYILKNVISDEQNSASTSETRIQEHDEIKAYLDCRYISAAEAAWRIYQFDMFYRKPAVERLSFHLPNQQPNYFQGHMTLENIESFKN
ncbi:uncharacterized protein [Arachis hypogaea]|uniref:uncharacterized protein n=1 Tax=Arachis hypogaea TaxID=3818 RepID=UPI003B20D43C